MSILIILGVMVIVTGLVRWAFTRPSYQATRRWRYSLSACYARFRLKPLPQDQTDDRASHAKGDKKVAMADTTPEIITLETDTFEASKPTLLPHNMPKIMILYLMAPPEQPYGGYALLQALLVRGLRYGPKNIFHRYAKSGTEDGPIWFSLASVHQPGTFILPQMGQYTCPGLTLFMVPSTNASAPALTVLNSMLEVAWQLSQDLGGEIWDDQHQLLQEEKVQAMRHELLQGKPISEPSELGVPDQVDV